MEINFLRSAFTVLGLITFVGIVVWAWSKKNKAGFDEAAQQPFKQD